MSSPVATSRLRLLPILIAQGIGVACGVAGVKVNSQFMPPEVLGAYGVYLTFIPIGTWVVHAGLVKFVGRHWAESRHRPALLGEMGRAWARRLPWLALAAASAAIAIQSLTSTSWWLLAVSLTLTAALLALGALVQAALQAERAHWRDCLVSSSGSVTRTFSGPLAFAVSGGLVSALWWGLCGHALVVAFVAAWATGNYWRRRSRDPVRPRTLSAVYEGPLFIALALAAWGLAGLNRWMVAHFFGPVEAGYFTLAGGAAVVVATTVGTVFMQYFQPGFFALGEGGAAAHASLARRVDKVAGGFALTGLAAVLAFQLTAPLLVGPLIATDYRAALPWILPGGCFAIATWTGIFFHSLLLAGRRERACGIVDLISAAVLVSGCFLAVIGGKTWFARWLVFTPLVPWLLTRPLARHYLFKPDATAAPSPAR